MHIVHYKAFDLAAFAKALDNLITYAKAHKLDPSEVAFLSPIAITLTINPQTKAPTFTIKSE